MVAAAGLRRTRAHGFFLDPEYGMLARLEYAQAIPGVTPGRGTGIIDTLHIGEVPVAFMAFEAAAESDPDAAGPVRETVAAFRQWFTEYLSWMRTSANGIEDRDHDLWAWTTADGRGAARGVDFILPNVRNKESWPFAIDVDHLFVARGLHRPDLLAVWTDLPPETSDKEIMRNLVYRSPALWFGPVYAE